MAPTRREFVKKAGITIATAGNLVNNFTAAQIAPPESPTDATLHQ